MNYSNSKKLFSCIFIIVLLSANLIGCGVNSEEIIEKLQTFTDMEEDDDSFTFTSKEKPLLFDIGWTLYYTKENEFVRFENQKIVDFIEERFGVICYNNGFSYDLDENEARIYLEAETEKGTLTIINYDLDRDEFTLVVDGDTYDTSESFSEELNSYGVADIFKSDIFIFKNALTYHNISFDDIVNLDYNSIKNK